MKAEEGNEDSFLDFTKKWISAIDRGGLFHIDDEAYILFYEIEKSFSLEYLHCSTRMRRKR